MTGDGARRADRFDGPLLHERWRLGARLGAGGQGRTYLARDERAGAEAPVVVVKVLRLGDAGWKRLDLFEREARVLGGLAHPGIPRVLDRFEGAPGTFYLVMEKAPGATLKAIATRVHFTEADLRDVLGRTLEILAYLHELRPPVIHRDVKPANLLRDADGRVSLVDFGGVREALREEGGTTVVGTFGYMAPEQLHGQATPATDLYGLGATIVQLAGGVEPERVPRRGLRMDLRRHLAGLPEDLLALLERMTEPEPDARLASAREALDLLRAAPSARALTPASPAALSPTPAAPSLTPAAAPADLEPAGALDDPGLPRPLRLVLRVMLLATAACGYVATVVLEAALVPLVFALVSAFAKDETRRTLARAEGGLRGALRRGRDGFATLQRRALRRGRRRPPPGLPPGAPPPRRRLGPRQR